jgi:hypothetical protein
MKLILDTLERARLAASPSDAIILADAIFALGTLTDAMADHGYTLDEVPATLDTLAAIVNHVAAQPFDTTTDADGATIIDETTPGAFDEWLFKLESLAQ